MSTFEERRATVLLERIAELEARNKRLEEALQRVLAKYEGENSARTGDYHLYDCDCMRCVIDDARAALSTKEDGT